MSLDKEIKYLKLAEELARLFSKDRSTQVGALFLHPTEFTILSAGYNGIPRGCDDKAEERHTRPLKYRYFEHAERNAIYNALRSSFRGCSVSCGTELGVDDVRAIISVGAASLAVEQLPDDPTALQLLEEAGVKVTLLIPASLQGKVLFVSQDGRLLASAEDASGEAIAEESAVRRAIFKAAQPLLENSTVVVGPLPPCAPCARALAAVGVRRVVSYQPTVEQDARWGDSFRQTRGLFTSLGIELIET